MAGEAAPAASKAVAPATDMAMEVQGRSASNGSLAAAAKPSQASLVTQRSIIRRADVAVRVDNVEKAEKQVDRMVAALGGYVDSATSTDLASDKPTIALTLRVPVGAFDRAIDSLEGLGVRLSKTINSEDVTTQIVDLDARLRTLSATEETYRGLLRQTHALQNVIDLQDKLTEVRSQIESMAAQRKALSGMASLSTITVRLEQSAVPAQAPHDPNWLAQTWGESTSRLGELLRSLASVGIWILVFIPLWLPVLWFAGRAYRANRSVRPVAPPVQPR
jgi:hypothetical protein